MSFINWLDPKNVEFPSVNEALSDPDGLLAVGGDLSSQRLIAAYRQGIFPWYSDPQPIFWWSPDPRMVMFPDKIHISRSLKKTLNKGHYEISFDKSFAEVIRLCSAMPRKNQAADTGESWITEDMMAAYTELHDLGIAHSVECWYQGNLVGGLYGINLGKVFFGESMFSLQTDASKVAFVYLAKQLQHWGFTVIDCQVSNPHLITLGAEEISRERFNRLLSASVDLSAPEQWQADWQWERHSDDIN